MATAPVGLAYKLAGLLALAALVLVTLRAAWYYAAGISDIEADLAVRREELSTRLRLTLPQSVIDLDRQLCHAALEAEMGDGLLIGAAVLLGDERQPFVCLSRAVDGQVVEGGIASLAPGLRHEFMLEGDGVEVGVVLLVFDLAGATEALRQGLQREVLIDLAGICLLVLLLVWLASRLLVQPLERLRLTMQRTEDAIMGSDSGAWRTRPTQTDRDRHPGGFAEIGRMANIFVDLVETVHNKHLQLADSEARLHTILDAIADAVIVCNEAAQVERLNPVAERLLGCELRSARGQSLAELLREGDWLIASLTTVLGGSQPLVEHVAQPLQTNDDQRHVVDAAIAVLASQEQASAGAVVVLRDVSRQRELEQTLRQSQKMESVGQLAGGVAHDFNNMLAGVIGSIELIAGTDVDDQQQRLLDVALDSAERAAELTRSLLVFARRSSLEREVCDLGEAVRKAVELLEHSLDKRIQLDVDLPGEMALTMGNANQLENVFLNLGVNARDAMPEGGRLSYRARIVTLSEDASTCRAFHIPAGSYWRLEVMDTGVGIEPAIRDRIFEPFFTTKEVGKGTGLGLAMVYGTIVDHGGALEVESAVGSGSTFILHLPLTDAAGRQRKPDELGSAHIGHGHILVVDDEATVRELTAMQLESLGYTVSVAADGSEAIATMRSATAPFGLVLLDLVMPKTDGADCFQALRAIDPAVPIVVCSGYDRDNKVDSLLAAGAVGFLHKPYRRKDLEAVLARRLRR